MVKTFILFILQKHRMRQVYITNKVNKLMFFLPLATLAMKQTGTTSKMQAKVHFRTKIPSLNSL